MKTDFAKKVLAIFVASLLILSVGLLPILADTETSADEANEPYVIFKAADMEGKLSGANQSEFEFVQQDGRKLLHLTAKIPDIDKADPYIAFAPGEGFSAEVYKYVTVIAKANAIASPGSFTLHYSTDGTGKGFQGDGRATAKYSSTTEGWQVFTYDMSAHKKWTGAIDRIRFDFFEGRGFRDSSDYDCYIVAMAFCQTPEDVYASSYEIINELYPAVQTVSDFTEDEADIVGGSPHSTKVYISKGNIFYEASDQSDPQAVFNYDDLMAKRNVTPLTTKDFRYTVIRYRTSMTILQPTMELFIMTGGTKDLFKMIRWKKSETSFACHSGVAQYLNSSTWRGVYVDMAEDDGLEENTSMKYGWKGRGEFNGFRFDWCQSGFASSYMEVAEFLFFKSEDMAKGYTEAINTISLKTFETPDFSDRETEDILMPWETEETEETTEETLPKFTEDTEETTTETEETKETESEPVTEDETGSEPESETEIEQGTSDGNNSGNLGEIEIEGIGGDEEKKDTGSQTPFYIACISLAGLSVASVVTVIVIRIKTR